MGHPEPKLFGGFAMKRPNDEIPILGYIAVGMLIVILISLIAFVDDPQAWSQPDPTEQQ